MELCRIISSKIDNIVNARGHLLDLTSPAESASVLYGILKLSEEYNLAIAPLLAKMINDPTSSMDEYIPEVYDIINNLNLNQRADAEISNIMSYAAQYGPLHGQVSVKMNSVMRMLSAAQNIVIENRNQRAARNVCKCGEEYVIIPELSKYQCPQCFRTKYLQGVVFDISSATGVKNTKNKNRNAIMRHYCFWMSRIQAREDKIIPPDIVSKIQYVIHRDGDNPQDLDCERMREILSDNVVNATRLNDHTSLLIILMGGPAPPQLTADESKKHQDLFVKIIALYDCPGNKPYYPYFIYKILENMFVGNTEKLRLLRYIHLQTPDTVIRRDIEFKDIVARSDPRDCLVYTPTDIHSRN
jgi:hypothetical protein